MSSSPPTISKIEFNTPSFSFTVEYPSCQLWNPISSSINAPNDTSSEGEANIETSSIMLNIKAFSHNKLLQFGKQLDDKWFREIKNEDLRNILLRKPKSILNFFEDEKRQIEKKGGQLSLLFNTTILDEIVELTIVLNKIELDEMKLLQQKVINLEKKNEDFQSEMILKTSELENQIKKLFSFIEVFTLNQGSVNVPSSSSSSSSPASSSFSYSLRSRSKSSSSAPPFHRSKMLFRSPSPSLSSSKSSKFPFPFPFPFHVSVPFPSKGFPFTLYHGDFSKFLFLIFLYFLQGIPLGLCLGALPFYLQNSNFSYSELAIFSLCSWPYSLKLLWSPFVDVFHFPSIGLRKSWILPCQTGIAILLIYLGNNFDTLIKHNDIFVLSGIFFITIILVATQDIAVDGWALSLLQPINLNLASTAQSVGQSGGFFISFSGLFLT